MCVIDQLFVAAATKQKKKKRKKENKRVWLQVRETFFRRALHKIDTASYAKCMKREKEKIKAKIKKNRREKLEMKENHREITYCYI